MGWLNKKGHGRYAHVVIALVVLAVLYYLNFTYNWVMVPTDTAVLMQLAVVAIIWSNISDIDQPGSVVNKWATTALVLVIVYSFINPVYQNFGILAAIIILLMRWIEHRTVIHSVLGGLILSAPLYYISVYHFAVGFIAFMSHIVSDNEFSWGFEKDKRLW